VSQTRTEIAALLDRHGLRPKHRLGQHFLADPNVTRRIVAASGVGSGDRVVEIGAGTGTLTAALAEAGARVVAYEMDEGLRPILEEVTEGLDVELRFIDATKADFGAGFPDGPWTLVANLPYNVGTGLVMDILRLAPAFARLVIMVQREVGERFVAGVGDDEYGVPSVVVGIHGEAKLLFRVPPQVFYPAPRVESVVIGIDRKEAPPHAERAVELAKAAFSKRRKMVRASLAQVSPDIVAVLESVGIEPSVRAEDLAPEDYVRLAEVLS
jgi:16S rRNA (adenine1518-N6/adenine1519-N6)-dimethyltransferase